MNQEPHEITLTFTLDGKVTGEIKGVTGPKCGPLMAWLKELGKVIEDRHTPDWWKTVSQTIKR